MSMTYGSQPPVSPLGGPADDGRNRLAQAMMNIQQPPGGMATPGVPGLPLELWQQGSQPPAAPMADNAGAMPAQGMALPGVMQPGQLPQNMSPQYAAGGSPPLPMPPRQGM